MRFKDLPWLVRVSVGISLFTVWYLFEQHVINPYLYPYLPGYRVGDPCLWDMGVATVIAWFVACKSDRCWLPTCRTKAAG